MSEPAAEVVNKAAAAIQRRDEASTEMRKPGVGGGGKEAVLEVMEAGGQVIVAGAGSVEDGGESVEPAKKSTRNRKLKTIVLKKFKYRYRYNFCVADCLRCSNSYSFCLTLNFFDLEPIITPSFLTYLCKYE